MQSLNQHISLFSNFATNHHQISSFGFGDFHEADKPYNDAVVRYARMWVDLQSTNVNDGALVRTYRIAFMDCVKPDERNENDVISDMEQVALDLLSHINKSITEDEDIVKSNSIEPFTESFSDKVSGVILNLQIVQAFTYNNCIIPIS